MELFKLLNSNRTIKSVRDTVIKRINGEIPESIKSRLIDDSFLRDWLSLEPESNITEISNIEPCENSFNEDLKYWLERKKVDIVNNLNKNFVGLSAIAFEKAQDDTLYFEPEGESEDIYLAEQGTLVLQFNEGERHIELPYSINSSEKMDETFRWLNNEEIDYLNKSALKPFKEWFQGVEHLIQWMKASGTYFVQLRTSSNSYSELGQLRTNESKGFIDLVVNSPGFTPYLMHRLFIQPFYPDGDSFTTTLECISKETIEDGISRTLEYFLDPAISNQTNPINTVQVKPVEVWAAIGFAGGLNRTNVLAVAKAISIHNESDLSEKHESGLDILSDINYHTFDPGSLYKQLIDGGDDLLASLEAISPLGELK